MFSLFNDTIAYLKITNSCEPVTTFDKRTFCLDYFDLLKGIWLSYYLNSLTSLTTWLPVLSWNGHVIVFCSIPSMYKKYSHEIILYPNCLATYTSRLRVMELWPFFTAREKLEPTQTLGTSLTNNAELVTLQKCSNCPNYENFARMVWSTFFTRERMRFL